eukprot:scaffold481_cov63-Attheya_sp.AAC.1
MGAPMGRVGAEDGSEIYVRRQLNNSPPPTYTQRSTPHCSVKRTIFPCDIFVDIHWSCCHFGRRGDILEAEEEPLGMDCREDAASIRGGKVYLSVSLSFLGVETDLSFGLAVLEGGLQVEGMSTIIRSEAAALSWSSLLDLLLDLSLRIIEGGWAEGGGLDDGLKEEGGSTINRSDASALSQSSFLDLILDLALRVIEGGWVMGTELSLQMCFDLDIQSAEGGGLGNGGGCGLGVAFSRPDAVSGAGAMAGFAVLGKWFHRRKVEEFDDGIAMEMRNVWGLQHDPHPFQIQRRQGGILVS